MNKQKAYLIQKEIIYSQVNALLEIDNIKTDEIIIHYVTENKIQKLHKHFFDIDSPTDCISIPIDSSNEKVMGHHILGEIFICPKTALKYAKEHNLSPFFEITLYLVHGILHLLGFSDIEKNDKKIMRKKEKEYMEVLKKKNLLG